MSLDIPGGHTLGIQGDNTLIEAVELPFVLLDPLRDKLAIAVTGDLQIALCVNTAYSFAVFVVARVAGVIARHFMF